MATRLGPAVISVALDTRAALRQLDELERRIAALRGPVVAQANAPLGLTNAEHQDRQRDEEGKKAETVAAKIDQQASTGRFGGVGAKLAAGAAAIAGAALLAEKFILPATGQAIKEIGEGTAVQGVTEGINKIFKDLSDRISDVSAKVEAIFPTISQMKDVGRARLLLGGRFDDADAVASAFYTINEAQSRIQRQRDKLIPEAFGKAVGAMWDSLRGGQAR